ncbi:MAG: sulfatase [Burkholderiaceae bacterium]
MPDKNKRPNVIFIYSDQLRADAIACAGNKDVKTPHIDRLAGEGVRFENAFVSYPLCTPFRASLLTGKYAHATGVYSNHFPIPTDQVFLATLLGQAGYKTGYIGKWHLYGGPKPGFVPPGPDRLGFEHFVGFNRGHEYMRSIYYRDTDQAYHSKRYEPDYQTDHLIEFMQGCVGSSPDSPFFGYVCLGPPHFPMDMPAHWKSMYDPNTVTLPHGVPNPQLQRTVQKQVIEHEFNGNPALAETSKTETEKVAPGEAESEAAIREFVAQYYGMISNVDFNVGRILNWLDASDLANDTIVVFFSDHGDMLGQHGHYCGIKRRPYRGSMQVPVVVRYPARFAGGQTPKSLIDFAVDTMPTILDLCGVQTPPDVQGNSYLPILDGQDTSVRDHVYYELMLQSGGQKSEVHLQPRRGIRTREWLYVREQGRRTMLFDLLADPHEEVNLVGQPDRAGLMDSFDTRIKEIMQSTGDDWGKEGSFPPPNYVTHEQGAIIHREILASNSIETS